MANDNKELINVTEEKPFTVLVSILFKNIYDWAIILLTNDNYLKISKTDKNEDRPVVGLDSKQNKLSRNCLFQENLACVCVSLVVCLVLSCGSLLPHAWSYDSEVQGDLVAS